MWNRGNFLCRSDTTNTRYRLGNSSINDNATIIICPMKITPIVTNQRLQCLGRITEVPCNWLGTTLKELAGASKTTITTVKSTNEELGKATKDMLIFRRRLARTKWIKKSMIKPGIHTISWSWKWLWKKDFLGCSILEEKFHFIENNCKAPEFTVMLLLCCTFSLIYHGYRVPPGSACIVSIFAFSTS